MAGNVLTLSAANPSQLSPVSARSGHWGWSRLALAALFTGLLIAPAPFFWNPPAWVIRLS